MREVIRHVVRLEERLVARVAAFATVRRSSIYATGFVIVTVATGVIRFLTLPNALADGDVAGDFRGFYHAGELVRLGQSAHLYDRLAEILRGESLEPPLMYPPLVASLYAPLSALPYGTALVVFWIVSLALWYAVSSILSREFHLTSPPRGLWQLVRFAPIAYSLAYGQMTVLWALALALFVVSLRRGRDVVAGLCLGLFALKRRASWAFFASFSSSADGRPPRRRSFREAP